MTNPTSAISLLQTLETLSNGLSQLSVILKDEQIALTRTACNDMDRLVLEKERLASFVEKTEQQRQAICGELNISPDLNGLNTIRRSLPAKISAQVASLWDKITELGHECASQNMLNGVLLSHQQRRTRNALSVLRGAVESGNVYSQKGATELQEYQNSLGHV